MENYCAYFTIHFLFNKYETKAQEEEEERNAKEMKLYLQNMQPTYVGICCIP